MYCQALRSVEDSVARVSARRRTVKIPHDVIISNPELADTAIFCQTGLEVIDNRANCLNERNITSLKTFARFRAQQILYAAKGLIAINKPPWLLCQSDKTFQEVSEFAVQNSLMLTDGSSQRKGRLSEFDSLLGCTSISY